MSDAPKKTPFIKIFSKENLYDHLAIGHPYRPTVPAFFFLKRGTIKIKAQFNILELKANSLVLIDNNSVYELMEVSQDVNVKLLSYQREYIEKLSLKFNKLNAYKTIRTEFQKVIYLENQEFDTLWRNIDNMAFYLHEKDNLHDEEYVNEILESFFAGLIYQFANLVSRFNRISKEKMSRPQEIVLQFVKLVSEFYLTEKTVEFYSQKMMMSSRHLSSVLKEVTGRTAIQIINEYIINEAKALLSSTSMSIKEIASALKFSDQYAFSHFFKKHLKINPSDYRAQF